MTCAVAIVSRKGFVATVNDIRGRAVLRDLLARPKLLNPDLRATLAFATLCRALRRHKERCPSCPSPIGERSIPGTATI